MIVFFFTMCVYAAVKHFVEFKINKETNVHQKDVQNAQQSKNQVPG